MKCLFKSLGQKSNVSSVCLEIRGFCTFSCVAIVPQSLHLPRQAKPFPPTQSKSFEQRKKTTFDCGLANSCSWLHRLELLRQAQGKDVIRGIKLTGKQPAAIEHPHWVYYYQVAQSLYRDKWITIIRLWWPSQWLVAYAYHLAVTTFLHVSPSTRRHKTLGRRLFAVDIALPLKIW